MTDIDPTTGLPTLPKGYFWRIRKWYYRGSENNLRITLMKKRWFLLPNREIGSGLAQAEGEFLGEDDVVYTTKRIKSKFLKSLHIDNRALAYRDSLIGDYPLKKYVAKRGDSAPRTDED